MTEGEKKLGVQVCSKGWAESTPGDSPVQLISQSM